MLWIGSPYLMERPTVERGEQLWQGGPTVAAIHAWSGGTIGGAVFGPAGPLAVQTTYSVTTST